MNEEHQSLSLVESAASSTWYPQSSSTGYPQVFRRQMALPAAPTGSRHRGHHGNRNRYREDECSQCAARNQCYQTACCGNSCCISMDESCAHRLQTRSMQGGCTQNYTEYTDCVQNTCTQTHYIDQYCSSNSSTPRRTPVYMSSTSSIPSVCPPVFPQCTITELPDDSTSPCQPESSGQSETSTESSSLSATNENPEPHSEGTNEIPEPHCERTTHRSEAYQVETNENPEPHFENTNEGSEPHVGITNERSDSEESPFTDIASLFTDCREEESVQSNSTSQVELSQGSETDPSDQQRDTELVRNEMSDSGKDLVDPGAINLSFIEEDAITISTREISAIASAGFGRSSGISTMNSNQTQDGSVQQTSRTRETVNVIDNDASLADQSQMISQGDTNNSDTHHLEDQNMDSSVVLDSQTSDSQNTHRHHTSSQSEGQPQTSQTTCGCSANRCHSHSVNSNCQITRRCRHSQHGPPIAQPQGCQRRQHRPHRPHGHSQRPPDPVDCECRYSHQGPLNPRASSHRHTIIHPHQQHRHRSSPHRHQRDNHSSRRHSRHSNHHHCHCSTNEHAHRHAQSQSRTHRRSPYRRAGRTATIMPLSAWNLRQFERSLPSEPPPPYMQWQLPPYMEQDPPPSYRSRATTPAHSLYEVDTHS